MRRASSISDTPAETAAALSKSALVTSIPTRSSSLSDSHGDDDDDDAPVSSLPTTAVPGRPRRKRVHRSKSSQKKRRHGFVYRFYKRWIRGSNVSSIFCAVVLWYSLGVISIGTSKLLLSKWHVPPLFLTLQQLVIGSCLLRFLLQIRFLKSSGLAPWPRASAAAAASERTYPKIPQGTTTKSSQYSLLRHLKDIQPSLLASSVFFCLGFLATNVGFSGSSAAFVETIKAAEPLTSATVAVWFGIEQLSRQETSSLLVIVLGVLCSTLGNRSSSESSTFTTLSESLQACMVVMISNLCFSFRGLYQKLFRATPEGSAQVLDDLNLQFRMQQVGSLLLVVPVLLFDSKTILTQVLYGGRQEEEEQGRGYHTLPGPIVFWQYLGLALLNGCAFCSYNLASTYILSRISVVHHAALNCIRRIFAIIVTSLYFGVPITLIGAIGIVVSFGGFLAFTHYKVKKQRQPKPLSSLLPVSAVN